MNDILEKIKLHSTPLENNQSLSSNVIALTDNIDQEDLVKIFDKELTRVDGKVLICQSNRDLTENIKNIIDSKNGKTIVYSGFIENNLTAELQKNLPDIIFFSTDSCKVLSELKDRISKADIGISVADYLIAETGTVAIFAKGEEGRLLSILSPINIIIAKKETILPDMKTFLNILNQKFGDRIPFSAIILITGPSRTADIEKILIIGVHGPKELYVVIN